MLAGGNDVPNDDTNATTWSPWWNDPAKLQAEPNAQSVRNVPLSLNNSMKYGVGPTSWLDTAVTVTVPEPDEPSASRQPLFDQVTNTFGDTAWTPGGVPAAWLKLDT